MGLYNKILVALENGAADTSLLAHVVALAKIHSSELLLVHVADGWAARNYNQLELVESEEMKEDRQYLEKVAESLRQQQLTVTTLLAMGEPPKEILKVAEKENCDLIAMGMHGHRWLADVIHGTTVSEVRHRARIPVLLIRSGT